MPTKCNQMISSKTLNYTEIFSKTLTYLYHLHISVITKSSSQIFVIKFLYLSVKGVTEYPWWLMLDGTISECFNYC